jgi:hypothetical protein
MVIAGQESWSSSVVLPRHPWEYTRREMVGKTLGSLGHGAASWSPVADSTQILSVSPQNVRHRSGSEYNRLMAGITVVMIGARRAGKK